MSTIEKITYRIFLICGIIFIVIGVAMKTLNIFFSGYVYDTAQGQLAISDPTRVTIGGWGYIYMGSFLLFMFIVTYLPVKHKSKKNSNYK